MIVSNRYFEKTSPVWRDVFSKCIFTVKEMRIRKGSNGKRFEGRVDMWLCCCFSMCSI